MSDATDVAILGGGLAGLTLALQLSSRRPELGIVVIDEKVRPAPERTSTVGESLSEIGSHYLREVVGLKDHLEDRQFPKFGLRFFVGDDRDLANRFEIGVLNTVICETVNGKLAGLPLRTHQVDRGRLENELADRCRERGVGLLEGTRAEHVELDRAGHSMSLAGEHSGSIGASWVIFAGGGRLPAHSLGWRSLDHRTRAAWFRVESDLDVGAWSTQSSYFSQTPPGFRRFSTNHLMGRGYWIWIIPLPSGVTSVGVVVDPSVVDFAPKSYRDLLRWVDARDPRVAEELSLTEPLENDFHVADLEAGVATTCFSGDRWAVVGQSAAFVDVLYSPGADLIALGNTLVVDLIERDLETGRLAGNCAIASRVFAGFAEGLADIYRGQYTNFGSPELVGTKVVWDSAIYFGFNTLLFRHGLFGDSRFLSHIGRELLTLKTLQARVQGRMRRGEITPLLPGGSATVDWGEVEWMMDAYLGAKEQPDERAVLAHLRKVLASLEKVARRIEGTT